MFDDTSVEKYFVAAIGGVDGLGNRSICRLVKFFGTAQSAWFADDADLMRIGIRRKSIENFIAFRRGNRDAPKMLADYCRRHNFKICSFFDDDYPPMLKEIDTPPMFFYYRGKLEPFATRIAVVGARDNTSHGQSVALELGEQLSAAGLTVVSGAARGIDTFAHTGALKSGRTVAVLGCGIEYAFSGSQRTLLEKIAENGVVISEFNLMISPTSGTLASRNRVIAGLSKGLVVVEAGEKSGSLIAANYAVNYQRSLFAVLGSASSDKSIGCHNLIRDGAFPVISFRSVLDKLMSDSHE